MSRTLIVPGDLQTLHSTRCAMFCGLILDLAGLDPGLSIAGVPPRPTSTKRRITGGSALPAPLVIEANEYVSTSKEDVALVSSSLTDEAKLVAIVKSIPAEGLIACAANDPRARAIVSEHARGRTSFYALDSDDVGDVTPTWLGILAPVDPSSGAHPFDLFIGGSSCGRFAMKATLRSSPEDDVRNAIGAVAACAEGFGVDVEKARKAVAAFGTPRPE